MCGVTKMDKIRNDYIRGSVKVGQISEKIKERRLQWFGHIMRRDEDYVGKRIMSTEVEGTRRRGRPQMRWMDNIKHDLKEKGITREQASDRVLWRKLIKNVDPI